MSTDAFSTVVAAVREAALSLPDTLLSARHARLLIALSGGVDSMLLLETLSFLKNARHSPSQPAFSSSSRRRKDSVAADFFANAELVAAHVHHGLSPNADTWLAHCEREACSRGVAFVFRRVVVPRLPQTSLEDAARRARRMALADMAEQTGADCWVFAHQQDDLCETLLLQLLRGAGPRGLAAMPVFTSGGKSAADLASRAIWRPLLSLPRSVIAAAAAERGIRWVEDESNADSRYRRNFLRHKVFPVIEEAFPGCRKTLARAASLQAEAVALLDASPAAQAVFPLSLPVFKKFPENIARKTLRSALRNRGLAAPSFERCAEMTRQLQNAAPDARVRLLHAGYALGIYNSLIHCYRPISSYRIIWNGETTLDLPLGKLDCCRVQGGGVRVAPGAKVEIVSRQNLAETLHRPKRPSRTLGDLLREAKIPPFFRDAYPRVYLNGVLAAVPGLGVDRRFIAGANETGVEFEFKTEEDM